MLQVLPSSDRPWKKIVLNFISGILVSLQNRITYNAIFIVVNYYLKMALYFLVTKVITVVEIADILLNIVFIRFGFPNSIVLD